MPITAYSTSAQRELDLEQWLAINGHQAKDDPELLNLPLELRELAARDIVCSSCSVDGATLVRGARSKATGRAVGQGHFRFTSSDGVNPHHQLCDFVDEGNDRSGEHLASFSTDKSALTRAIRDLVCRGISAGLFTSADLRSMRSWFFKERVSHTMLLDVEPDLIFWCKEASDTRRRAGYWGLPFQREHTHLPGFDWDAAAAYEWVIRNKQTLDLAEPGVHFHGPVIERANRLVVKHGGQLVLDPSALRDKYRSAVHLSRFAADHLFGPTGKSPLANKHDSDWGAPGHSLLALSALLLFLSDWQIDRAGALYARLHALPPMPEGLDGNLMGLNPFHDFHAWQLIRSARLIGGARNDSRPVHEQVADVKAELLSMQGDWINP